MDTKQKVENLKSHSEGQFTKVKEILETVRAIHGEDIGDKITLVSNMLVHASKQEMLVMAMMQKLDDVGDLVKFSVASIEVLEMSHKIPIAVFHTVIEDPTKREELVPTIDQIREVVLDINKRAAELMGAI